MEWKIGEIRQINDEWYQCVKGECCKNCDLDGLDECCSNECRSDKRKDDEEVIYKKLEKVGEPYMVYGHIVQNYKFFHSPAIQIKGMSVLRTINSTNTIKIEIKQNKEDMEEKKLSLKPFDVQKAKEGKPVYTRDGRKARIICFDAKGDFPIAALVETNNIEEVYPYTNNGLFHLESNDLESNYDLMMLSEKKEGWVNVYKSQIHYSLKSAKEGHKGITDYIKTIKVEWEE